MLITFADCELDLSAVEQLVEKSQARAVADCLQWMRARLSSRQPQGRTLAQLLSELSESFDREVQLLD